jgi:hypothetical protein
MLRLIFWIILIILVLSFFGISLQSLFASPTTHANFGFAGQLVLNGWNLIVQFFQTVLASVGVHVT